MPTAITHDPTFTTPVSSTNTAVVRWSGTTGATLQDSGVLIDGSNNVTIPGYLYLSGDEKELRFYEGSNFVAIKTNASLAGDYTLTLPLNDGSANEFLQTNGSGVLTWAAASSTPTSTWIPTHAMRSTTAESVNHWDYAALYMDASNTDTICVSGVFAATPTAVKWIIMPTLASGSIVYTLTSDYASVGQTLQTHQDSTGNTTLPTTNNTLQALDVMISPNNFFGSAVAGDFFGMIFSRIGGNGSDTLNATLAVIGLLVEY